MWRMKSLSNRVRIRVGQGAVTLKVLFKLCDQEPRLKEQAWVPWLYNPVAPDYGNLTNSNEACLLIGKMGEMHQTPNVFTKIKFI